MSFQYAYTSYKKKEYLRAVDYFKEALDDECVTEDYKLTCRQYIVLSLVEDSKIKYENNDYTPCELLEEAINMVNSDWKLKDRIGDSLNRSLKYCLIKTYEHLA